MPRYASQITVGLLATVLTCASLAACYDSRSQQRRTGLRSKWLNAHIHMKQWQEKLHPGQGVAAATAAAKQLQQGDGPASQAAAAGTPAESKRQHHPADQTRNFPASWLTSEGTMSHGMKHSDVVGDADCSNIHEKEKCTPDGCLWCDNKYSPWAGSDGVCVSEEQAQYLPDVTYECQRVKPVTKLVAAA